MAKKKGKTRSEPKSKTGKAKKKVPAREPKRIKSAGRSGAREKTRKRKPANPKKPAAAKKSVRGKAIPPKKTSGAQKGSRKPAKVSGTGRRTAAKNKASPARTKTRKRTPRPFKIGDTRKRVTRKNASADWNFIRDASYGLPKRQKVSTKTLRGSKDKSRGSEFYGKEFKIRKVQKFFKGKTPTQETRDFLVGQNYRLLKLNGKKKKKVFLKAYYVDASGMIRIIATTRKDIKSKRDLTDKVNVLIDKIRGYQNGDNLEIVGFETEEVTETWDANEDEELGQS